MASILKIKRSTGSQSPATLAAGELAYAWDGGNSGAGGKLFIGTGTENVNGEAQNIATIGGQYFTDMLDHTKGTLTANSALVVDANSKLDQLKVDDLELNGSSITSTNTNGNINITPNGTGKSIISNLYTDSTTSLQAYIQSITGTAFTFVAGEGIDIGVAGSTVTIDAEKATTSNLGVASFSTDNFTVTDGAVAAKNITLGSTTLSLGTTTTAVAGITQLDVDQIRIDGGTISATNANGSITLAPDGTGTVDVSNKKITNVATPTSDNDAANKAYVDAARTGLDVKASVRVATTANITLSGTQTIDGIELSANDRVLVKNQTTASENGIYVVSSDAWTRATDADNSPSGEVTSGMFTFVEQGTVNQNTGFVLTTTGTITLGTTALAFTVFSTSGTLIAGAGLVKNGDTLEVQVGDGIEVSSDTVKLASSVAGAGLTLTTGVLSVNATGGLEVTSDNVQLASSVAGSGLAFSSGVLSVNVDNGIAVVGDTVQLASGVAGGGLTLTTGVLAVQAGGGIEVASDTVQLASSVAGNGLTLATGVLAVGAGTGITVNADDVALTGQALAFHNLSTNGLVARTDANTVAARSIATNTAGISVTNGDAVAGNPTISLTAALYSIGGLTPAADRLAYYTGSTTAALATFTSFARDLLDDADASTMRTTLGLGSMATQASNNVSITGGSIDGVTLDGGTY